MSTYNNLKDLLRAVIDGGNLAQRIEAARRVTAALRSLGICTPFEIPEDEEAAITAEANATYDALPEADRLTIPRGAFVDKFVSDRMVIVQKHYDAAEQAWTDRATAGAAAAQVEHDKFVADEAKKTLAEEDAEKAKAEKKQADIDAKVKAAVEKKVSPPPAPAPVATPKAVTK